MRSGSHGPSQGIDPLSSSSRIPAEFALTSSYDQRSKWEDIAPRSRSRKSGLTSRSKLTGSVDTMRLLHRFRLVGLHLVEGGSAFLVHALPTFVDRFRRLLGKRSTNVGSACTRKAE